MRFSLRFAIDRHFAQSRPLELAAAGASDLCSRNGSARSPTKVSQSVVDFRQPVSAFPQQAGTGLRPPHRHQADKGRTWVRGGQRPHGAARAPDGDAAACGGRVCVAHVVGRCGQRQPGASSLRCRELLERGQHVVPALPRRQIEHGGGRAQRLHVRTMSGRPLLETERYRVHPMLKLNHATRTVLPGGIGASRVNMPGGLLLPRRKCRQTALSCILLLRLDQPNQQRFVYFVRQWQVLPAGGPDLHHEMSPWALSGRGFNNMRLVLAGIVLKRLVLHLLPLSARQIFWCSGDNVHSV